MPKALPIDPKVHLEEALAQLAKVQTALRLSGHVPKVRDMVTAQDGESVADHLAFLVRSRISDLTRQQTPLALGGPVQVRSDEHGLQAWPIEGVTATTAHLRLPSGRRATFALKDGSGEGSYILFNDLIRIWTFLAGPSWRKRALTPYAKGTP